MKEVFHHIRDTLTKPERKRFFALSLLDIFINLLDIAFLALLVWLVQFCVQPVHTAKSSFLPSWFLANKPLGPLLIYFFAFIVKNIVGLFITKAQYALTAKVAVRLACDNLEAYQQCSYDEYVNTDSSVTTRRVVFQPVEFCQYVLSGAQQIITQCVLIVATISAILIYNSNLFLLLLAVLLPPVVAVFYFMKKRLGAAREQIKATSEKSLQHLAEAVKGYVESNVYGKNAFFLKRFEHYRRRFSDHLFHSLFLQNIPGRIMETFAVLGLFALILIANNYKVGGEWFMLTIGAFMAAAYKIIPGTVKAINLIGQMRSYSQHETVAKRKNAPKAKERKAPMESIVLNSVSFKYGNNTVLNNLSLQAERGDMIGISGRSGKGKTTILNLLLGFLSPQEGTVSINGELASSEEVRGYWPAIAYVRQQSFIVNDSLVKNIALEENANRQKVDDVVRLSGLDKVIAADEARQEMMVTENGKNLSGGQVQRIAIARALYKDADLLLLDEPFNELDDASEKQLLVHFKQLAEEGKIVILITHNKKSLSYCNKIISLDEEESAHADRSYARLSGV